MSAPVTGTTARGKERISEETGEAREVADRRAGVGPLATLMAGFAVAALFLTVGSLLVIGGVVFALFLFFPLFLGALVGVLAGLEDHTVKQHNPSMDGTRWRKGSKI